MSYTRQLNADRLERELAAKRTPARVESVQVDGNLDRIMLERCTVKRSLMRHVAENLGIVADASCRATFKVIGGVIRVVFLVLRHE